MILPRIGPAMTIPQLVQALLAWARDLQALPTFTTVIATGDVSALPNTIIVCTKALTVSLPTPRMGDRLYVVSRGFTIKYKTYSGQIRYSTLAYSAIDLSIPAHWICDGTDWTVFV